MISLWLLCLALPLGVSILHVQETALMPVLLVVGYLAVLIVLVDVARAWRDAFAPLCVVLVFGLIRFCLPGILIMLGVDPEAAIFRAMGLQQESLRLGHVLALTSLAGICLGWLLIPGRPREWHQLRSDSSKSVRDAAVIAMIVGFVGLLLFVAGNVSLPEAIFKGTLRGTTIQSGTGKFFFLSYFLLAGSIVLTAHLRTRAVEFRWTALLPVLLAMVSFWVLGGRGRALSPMLNGLLILWYVGRERRRWPPLSVGLVSGLVLIGVPLMAWLGHFGQLYRGGGGIQALGESLSLSGIWGYLRGAIFTDIGHLHALAGAVSLRPAILEGTTFNYSLLWPLSQLFDFFARSPGVFLIEHLGGGGPRRGWGLAPGLIGETYMDFGSLGVPIVMIVYGLVLKMLYVKFRTGRLHFAIYTIAAYQLTGIFWGGIGAWPFVLVIVALTVFIFKVAAALSRFEFRPAAMAKA